jgi:hypothetical protein
VNAGAEDSIDAEPNLATGTRVRDNVARSWRPGRRLGASGSDEPINAGSFASM